MQYCIAIIATSDESISSAQCTIIRKVLKSIITTKSNIKK